MKKLSDILKEAGIEMGKIYTDKDRPPFKTESEIKGTKLVKEGPAYEFGKENANIERAKILLDKAMDKMAKTLTKKGHKDKAKYLIQKWNKYDEMIDDCLDDTLGDLL